VTARPFLIFLAVVILTAFFVRSPHAHDLPCFMEESSSVVQPAEYLRGAGLTDEGLFRLSVDDDGVFLITLTPPNQPIICVVNLGKNWVWVPATPVKKQQANSND